MLFHLAACGVIVAQVASEIWFSAKTIAERIRALDPMDPAHCPAVLRWRNRWEPIRRYQAAVAAQGRLLTARERQLFDETRERLKGDEADEPARRPCVELAKTP